MHVDVQTILREEGDITVGVRTAVAIADVSVQMNIVSTLGRKLLTAIYKKGIHKLSVRTKLKKRIV